MRWLMTLLIGCRHDRLTRPFTRDRARGAYVVCLDCGKEFSYSLDEMRVM